MGHYPVPYATQVVGPSYWEGTPKHPYQSIAKILTNPIWQWL